MPPAVEIATAVVAHFQRVRRDLPWRRTRDPYAIWVSEVMLQQTRVETVVPYWQRWMTAFPTVAALASAPLDDVLAAWAGLGYYSRARNLHAGAKAFRAGLPQRASELRAVPGIGAYTAGAIASIAFGERTPLVDGNVARVLARVYAIADDIKSTRGQRELWRRAGELMAALPATSAPGDLNQGLMELGATACSKATPKCGVCPIASWCEARRSGRQSELPVVAKRRKESELPVLSRAALWLEDAGEIVLARRVPSGLFGGLWELPQADDRLEIAGRLGVTAVEREPVAFHDQTLTHRRLRIAVFRAAMPRRLVDPLRPPFGGATRRASARLVDRLDPSYDAFARVAITSVGELGVAAATTAILAKYKDSPWSSTPKRSPSSRPATSRSSKASRSSATTRRTKTSPTPRSARRKRSTS